MTNKKRTIKCAQFGGITLVIIVLFAITIAFTLYIVSAKNSILESVEAIETRIANLEYKYGFIKEQKSNELLATLDTVSLGNMESSATRVLFTNYGTWDGHSTNTTASMFTIEDFELNEYGMYTYDGLVVLATANVTRLPWPLADGYNTHELYEIVEFVLEDQLHKGIVLDVCGACYNVQGEDKQRYDVFTTHNVIGLKEGYIYE